MEKNWETRNKNKGKYDINKRISSDKPERNGGPGKVKEEKNNLGRNLEMVGPSSMASDGKRCVSFVREIAPPPLSWKAPRLHEFLAMFRTIAIPVLFDQSSLHTPRPPCPNPECKNHGDQLTGPKNSPVGVVFNVLCGVYVHMRLWVWKSERSSCRYSKKYCSLYSVQPGIRQCPYTHAYKRGRKTKTNTKARTKMSRNPFGTGPLKRVVCTKGPFLLFGTVFQSYWS